MAHTRIQPYWPGGLGRSSDPERALRPALYIRHVRHDSFLYADGDRIVHPAPDTAGHSALLPLHWIPLAPGDLRSDFRRVDAEHDYYATLGGPGRNRDCAARGAGILVL